MHSEAPSAFSALRFCSKPLQSRQGSGAAQFFSKNLAPKSSKRYQKAPSICARDNCGFFFTQSTNKSQKTSTNVSKAIVSSGAYYRGGVGNAHPQHSRGPSRTSRPLCVTCKPGSSQIKVNQGSTLYFPVRGTIRTALRGTSRPLRETQPWIKPKSR